MNLPRLLAWAAAIIALAFLCAYYYGLVQRKVVTADDYASSLFFGVVVGAPLVASAAILGKGLGKWIEKRYGKRSGPS